MKKMMFVWMLSGCCAIAFAGGQQSGDHYNSASPSVGTALSPELPFDFTSVAPIRPHEFTPLESQIHELELQQRNNCRPQPLDDSSFMAIKLQLAELYNRLPREHNPLDDGADACPAVTIPNVIPYTDYGTTVGAINNFSPSSLCPPNNAPDKIYRFVPTHAGQFDINTFGSTFDTQLYVTYGGPCPGNTLLNCNDDYGGSQSQVSVNLSAGQEYFIIVDGFSNYSGNYVLHLTDICLIANSGSFMHECAENTNDPAHAMFDCNGGCNNGYYGGFNSWQTLYHCQWVHGNVFTYTGPYNYTLRDEDFYTVTTMEPCSLEILVAAAFTSNIVIYSGTNCPDSPIFSVFDLPACQGNTYITPCVPAGTYSIGIMPNFVGDMTTPRPYLLDVELLPCSGCKVDLSFVAPLTGGSDNTCGAGNENSLRPSPEKTYCVTIPYASDWTFSVCGANPVWDSFLYLSNTCNGSVIAFDDDGCSTAGFSQIRCLPLNAGSYYLTVEGYQSTDCGMFNISVTECIGSCCYGDPNNPSCSYGPLSACNALGGNFTLGQQCAPGLCYTRPSCDVPEAEFSQQPHVPDETWSAFASDTWTPNRIYENYSVSNVIGTIRFWGLHLNYNTGLPCPSQPHAFALSFIDSSNGPAVQTYNLTLTGTLLPLNYGANYPMYEYTAHLPTACTILAGRVRIVGQDNNACVFHWATSPLGDGSVVLVNSGGTVVLPRDVAVCLGRGCQAPDSVVIRVAGANACDICFRLYESSYVRLYYTTNVNAVFPANYIPITAGSLLPGNWFATDVSGDPQRRYVLTAQCGPPPIFKTEPANSFQRIE